MDFAKTQQERKLYASRLSVMTVVAAASIVTNACLSMVLVGQSRTLIIPTIPAEVSIDAYGAADPLYLERFARDVSFLFLNRSPETLLYFQREAQKIMEPTAYQEMHKILVRDRQEAIRENRSQSWFPNDFYVDPKTMYVEIRGTIRIEAGGREVDAQNKIYALTFSKNGQLVRLKSFTEITPEDARGEKVKPLQTLTEG
ncbi:type IV conjugative transfer system protein TraE [Asticcacaulis sp. BYS171W]|uniref:Type IV conjugative transfer system protein TraE n=1 Tax=Asticcacaulis aquaticus TaxID=2984212 RepID=A0ABT5HWD7_9CAUL|nr:type IV conjugative transfer system protein TraE [Asticcacaulis aquaticus]MDC7684406.1 type IV conjugative transfer system protein TraE [Asticcacaulis aquaticus]